MSNQRRLGRGLEALLGKPPEALHETVLDNSERPVLRVVSDGGDGLLQLGVNEIDSNPFQPRSDFDAEEIGRLAESLQAHGLLQPVLVRRMGPRFQLISGERRLRAAITAGWNTVPAQVREADDRQMAEMAIVENLQRRDLNPLEKAASFQGYLARFACTQEELAKRLGIDRSTIANLIRLLELPSEVHQAIRKGAISPGHARALLPLGDEREQIAFAARIVSQGLSVRATEEQVGELLRGDEPSSGEGGGSARKANAPRGRRTRSSHQASLEQELRAALGTRVDLRQSSSGRGKLILHFGNASEFERLRQSLLGSSGGARGRERSA